MARVQSRARSTGAYPGPSREELGDLAEWVTESDLSELRSAPMAVPAPVPIAKAAPERPQAPQPYPGPTREELGDLGRWLDTGSPCSSTRGPSSFSPSTSLRGIDAELWVSDREPLVTVSDEEPKVARRPAPPPPSTDPFLEQLDEIQVALRKRAG